MMPGRINPRKTALNILDRFFTGGGSLKQIISETLDSTHLKGLDRRFVFNLAKGTVRYYLRSDYLISHLSRRKTSKIEPSVLNILRMGAYQSHLMDGVPAYSIVDESVKLTRGVSSYASGFANAVMRRITEINDPVQFIENALRKEGASREDILSVVYSFPVWIIKYWIKYFGEKTTVKICSQLNSIPVFYIRSNSDRYTGELAGNKNVYAAIAGSLENMEAKPVMLDVDGVEKLAHGFSSVLGPVLKNRYSRESQVFEEASSLSSTMGLEKEALYMDGVVTVQDLSSQMGIKYFLDPQKGGKILDCCAAPGGKASFAAQIMKNTGHIVAVDKSHEKIRILKDNIKRLGMTNTTVILSDASQPGFLDRMENIPEGYFDSVIVDAPCTALGTIGKNPEVKYNRSPGDIDRLSELSLDIMSACHPYLRKGGKMVFYTCSISPVENGQAVRRFISLVDGKYDIAKCGATDMEMNIMPHYLKSEGGYICVLEKKE